MRTVKRAIHKGRRKKNQEYLFYCEKCSRVWELVKYNGKRGIEYYNTLPSFGKEHKDCPNCEDNKI